MSVLLNSSTLLLLSLSTFLLFSTIPIPALSAKCNPDDKKALIRINQFWGNPLASWTNTTGCCAWYGVDCDSATGNVIGLAIFADTSISGTIPPAIGDLPHLRQLDIRKLPNLVGPIIPELARLTNLTFLRMDWNGLTGPVPSFLAKLANLDYVNLSFNRLSGTIPPALATLTRLDFLRLDRNQLTGPIPDSFGKFKSGFFGLFLSNNNLTGHVPRSLGAVDFTRIDLSRNRLTGDASFLFGASKSAQIIDLSRNVFEFDLSTVEFPVAQLALVDLNHNAIYGKIPAQIAKLENLQAFNVSYNRLCGEIPTGGNMGRFDQSTYIHNRCLCGAPLPPCK